MPIEELLKMYQSMHDIGDEVTDDADTNLDDGEAYFTVCCFSFL